MGVVAEIGSLEEMCDLMCDNVLPNRKGGDRVRNTK